MVYIYTYLIHIQCAISYIHTVIVLGSLIYSSCYYIYCIITLVLLTYLLHGAGSFLRS